MLQSDKLNQLVQLLLEQSAVELPIQVPPEVERNLASAQQLVDRVRQIVGDNGHGEYFNASTSRYAYYLAALANLPAGSRVLNVGGRPGPVSIGAHLLGHDVVSIHLNDEWRKSYPSEEWLKRLQVTEVDIEHQPLPYPDASFQAVLFTEVLEHFAIADPARVLIELNRVLAPGGLFILSTPNACNVSNFLALLKGWNIFWEAAHFDGSTDRHNREFTPRHVLEIVRAADFDGVKIFGINSGSNWCAEVNEEVSRVLSEFGDQHPILRNTIMILASRDGPPRAARPAGGRRMPMRVAVVCPVPITGESGGVERFHQWLVAALNAEDGVQADLVAVPADESCWEAVQETMRRFQLLDLSAYDAAISTKAPAYLLQHPNHICYLAHTMRVFYDMWEQEFPNPSPALLEQRQIVHRLDTAALKPPQTRKVFTIGEEVRQRLLHYNGLDAEVLHLALDTRQFHCLPAEPYVFLPGRLHRWKRVDLAIRAMQHLKRPLDLLISGTGEDEELLRRLAQGDARIRFLGRVSDEELVDLYARALVVAFLPIREDFGLVTLEAFRSGKPVLTCTDSGEPARIVADGKTGFVSQPDPKTIAELLEFLYDDPSLAAQMGRLGFGRERDFSWKNVTKRLLAVLRDGPDVPAGRSRSAEAPLH